MSYEHILTDLDDDGILTVTLHRPEAMNAWTMTMTKELVDMVEKADANDDVACFLSTLVMRPGAVLSCRGRVRDDPKMAHDAA